MKFKKISKFKNLDKMNLQEKILRLLLFIHFLCCLAVVVYGPNHEYFILGIRIYFLLIVGYYLREFISNQIRRYHFRKMEKIVKESIQRDIISPFLLNMHEHFKNRN